MKVRITEDMLAKVERIAQKALDERFADDGLVFGPIIAIPRIDHYGEEYVQVYIVFDGDQKRLDPSWTVDLSELIQDHFDEDEMPHFPDKSFIGKDEWEEWDWETYIRGRATWNHAI